MGAVVATEAFHLLCSASTVAVLAHRGFVMIVLLMDGMAPLPGTSTHVEDEEETRNKPAGAACVTDGRGDVACKPWCSEGATCGEALDMA